MGNFWHFEDGFLPPAHLMDRAGGLIMRAFEGMLFLRSGIGTDCLSDLCRMHKIVRKVLASGQLDF